MLARKYRPPAPPWVVPLVYSTTAISAGLLLPRIETRLFPGLSAGMSVSAAQAIYSSIASGMMALTGIVFSMAFVMVQFSATAYSPRLVVWMATDRLMSHAMGVFSATFIYAIAALAWVGRHESTEVPFVSTWIVVGLLIASVWMFAGLVGRLTRLQVNRMLSFTGDQGRGVIDELFPQLLAGEPLAAVDDRATLPVTQVLVHHGRPRTVQAHDTHGLLRAAIDANGVIEVAATVGDTLVEQTPLLRLLGGHRISDHRLHSCFVLGRERTFAQDPKYALRLLVDIAIRALSPAVNDPTTAVQALDQVQDLLLRLGLRSLEIGTLTDSSGAVRVVIPLPTWEDYVTLGLEEIRQYGAGSMQVMRRMRALVADLIAALPEERQGLLRHYEERLRSTVDHAFADVEDRQQASVMDRQGIGVSHAPR
ncbi:MAG TPA: DUF2254 domain-containing protein [Gemmatimonadaceae bacterium]|nr:DUF2254 domain-containing protein [Gemmatimonadaceae bacterium]